MFFSKTCLQAGVGVVEDGLNEFCFIKQFENHVLSLGSVQASEGHRTGPVPHGLLFAFVRWITLVQAHHASHLS